MTPTNRHRGMTEADLPLPPCKRARRALVNDPEKTAILGLPDELLMRILERLDGRSLRIVRQTCRQLRHLSMDDSLLPNKLKDEFVRLYGAIAPSEVREYGHRGLSRLLERTEATLNLLAPIKRLGMLYGMNLSRQCFLEPPGFERVAGSRVKEKQCFLRFQSNGMPEMVQVSKENSWPSRVEREETARLVGRRIEQGLAICAELQDQKAWPLSSRFPLEDMKRREIRIYTVAKELKYLWHLVQYAHRDEDFLQNLRRRYRNAEELITRVIREFNPRIVLIGRDIAAWLVSRECASRNA